MHIEVVDETVPRGLKKNNNNNSKKNLNSQGFQGAAQTSGAVIVPLLSQAASFLPRGLPGVGPGSLLRTETCPKPARNTSCVHPG